MELQLGKCVFLIDRLNSHISLSKKIQPVVKKVKTHPGTREIAVVAQSFISYILGKSEFSDSKPVGSDKEKQKQ